MLPYKFKFSPRSWKFRIKLPANCHCFSMFYKAKLTAPLLDNFLTSWRPDVQLPTTGAGNRSHKPPPERQSHRTRRFSFGRFLNVVVSVWFAILGPIALGVKCKIYNVIVVPKSVEKKCIIGLFNKFKDFFKIVWVIFNTKWRIVQAESL